MELLFRNRKGTKEESAKLRKGSIHDSLSTTFVFLTIRVAHVAQELSQQHVGNKTIKEMRS